MSQEISTEPENKTIDLQLLDMNGELLSKVTVPAEAQIKKLLAAFVDVLNFPITFSNGIRIQYSLKDPKNSLTLDEEGTLVSLNYIDGSILQLSILNMDEKPAEVVFESEEEYFNSRVCGYSLRQHS
jgi:hypothetical protein